MAGFFVLLPFVLSCVPVFASPVTSDAPSNGIVTTQQQSKKARERMMNREKLLASAKKRLAVVPLTPEQKKRQADIKLAQRSDNREQLAMHTRWWSGHADRSDSFSALSTKTLMAEMSSPRVEDTIHKIIRRLKEQLGKPYVWGGQSPEKGFDCSGLVYYAYNKLLNRKLPRTANGMYQDDKLKRIKQHDLRHGDLIFFAIKTQNEADHVGVYLGDGQFIEAPRTGLNIRISQLADNFWQDHFLGARRIVTDDVIL